MPLAQTTLGDVSPSLAAHYQANVVFRYPVNRSDLSLRHSAECPLLPDCDHLCFCELNQTCRPFTMRGPFRAQHKRVVRTPSQALRMESRSITVARRRQSSSCGVGAVFCSRYVFKIIRMVVGFHPVLMVYLHTFRVRAKESGGDKLMNAPVSFNPRRASQQYRNVTSRVDGCSQYLGSIPTSIAVRNCFNPSDTGHHVRSFVTRDRLPSFVSEFFCGKLLFSHCGNLLSRFAFWLGSFGVQPSFEPLVF
jgi:hypothetical protein